MNDPLSEKDDASTPLSPEEREGLKFTHITLRSELNEVEQKNILKAEIWAFSRQREVLSDEFLYELHKRMLGDVWEWAGVARNSEKNIGVAPYQITTNLRNLIEDVKCWIENDTYKPDEMAARFHHRLVKIHPFPNGNGRHARMAADLLLVQLGQQRFTWGKENLVDANETRQKYIQALRAADEYDYELLFEFVRQ